MSKTYTDEEIFGAMESQPQKKTYSDEEIFGTPSRTALGTAKDALVSTAKGIVGAGQGLVGLADIPTAGKVGKAFDNIGIKPSDWQESLSEQYSPAQQAVNKKIDDAEGFFDTAGQYLKNPSAIAHGIIETLPTVAAGGVIGRGALAAGAKLAPKALAPRIVDGVARPTAAQAIGAGAFGEGTMIAGQSATSIREQTADGELTGKQAGLAALSGVLGGAFGVAGGALAKKLGVFDPDQWAFGVTGKKKSFADVAKAVVGGGISEGVFEELPQTVQETILQNAALDKPLLEGVPKAAASGLILGTAMGAGANLLPGRSAQAQQPPPVTDQTPPATDPTEPILDGSIPSPTDADIPAATAPPAPPAGPVSKAAAGAGLAPPPQQEVVFQPVEDEDGVVFQPAGEEVIFQPVSEKVPGATVSNAAKAGGLDQAGAETTVTDKATGLTVDPTTGEIIEPWTAGLPGATEEAAAKQPSVIQESLDNIGKADAARLAEIEQTFDARLTKHPEYEPYRQELWDAVQARKAAIAPKPNAERHAVVDNPDSVADLQTVNVEPSEAQKEAGNYQKGHVKLDGFDISIENPVGSVRSGKDASGREWQTEMAADYGYFKGTKGKDKDHIDVFIKPGYQGGGKDVYVVNQYNADGTFDEHKTVLGATSEAEAMAIYNSNYEAGWTGGKEVTRMPVDQFKMWSKGAGPSKGALIGNRTVKFAATATIGKEGANDQGQGQLDGTERAAAVGAVDKTVPETPDEDIGERGIPGQASSGPAVGGREGGVEQGEAAEDATRPGVDDRRGVDGRPWLTKSKDRATAEVVGGSMQGIAEKAKAAKTTPPDAAKEKRGLPEQMLGTSATVNDPQGAPAGGDVQAGAIQTNGMDKASLYRDWLGKDDRTVTAYPSEEQLAAYQKEAENILAGKGQLTSKEDFLRFSRLRSYGNKHGFTLRDVYKAFDDGHDVNPDGTLATSWNKKREETIKASRDAGNVHLDKVPAYVETMRGKEIYNVHDPKERGVIRTVSNRGDVVVHWSDKYSADKNSATEKYEVRGKKRKTVYESWLMPSDLKDYALSPGKTTPPPSQASQKKEPWEMTKEEFAKEAKVSRGNNYIAVKFPSGGDYIIRSLETEKYSDDDAITGSHLDFINTAIKQGKTIPAAVLKDYPDIAAKYGQAGGQTAGQITPTIPAELTNTGVAEQKKADKQPDKLPALPAPPPTTTDGWQKSPLKARVLAKELGISVTSSDGKPLRGEDVIAAVRSHYANQDRGAVIAGDAEEGLTTAAGRDTIKEKGQETKGESNGNLATGNEAATNRNDRDGDAGNVPEGVPPYQGSGKGATGVPETDRTSLDGGVRPGSAQAGESGGQEESAAAGDATADRDGDKSDLGDGAGQSPRVSRKPVSAGRDYRIPTGGIKREGSWKETARRNLDIIELAKKLEAEKRPATKEEQELLAKYTGFGATEIANNLFPGYAQHGEIRPTWARDGWEELAQRMVDTLTPAEIKTAARSTQYAHYTSEAVINSIYKGLARFGFDGGKVLEPGAGSSSFWGLMPQEMHDKSRYTGIEMDHVTALIAKHLYPEQDILRADFTQHKLPGNFFDLAIGNPPFGDIAITSDPEYKRHKFFLHDYFFAKSVDKVRPGGLLVFVTSKGTMDKAGDRARKYLGERADLLGAIRLPQTAFKQQSGTEVVTDVLFFRKREAGQEVAGAAWQGLDEVQTPEGPTLVNEYFAAHPEMVLGSHSLKGSMYGKDQYTVMPLDGDIEEHFAKAIDKLPQDVYTPEQQKKRDAAQKKAEAAVEFDFNPDNKKEGGVYLDTKGNLMRTANGAGKTVTVLDGLTEKQIAWLKDYVPLRNAVKKAQYDQLSDGSWEKSLKALNKEYDKFVKKHGTILENTITEKQVVDEDGEESLQISKRYKNKKVMWFDAEAPLVLALEKEDENGAVTKGPFLKGRSIQKPEKKKPVTIADAMALSLDELGELDIADIAATMNLPEAEVIDGLGTLIYKNPDNGKWEPRDAYLSGNVRAKLQIAQAAAAADDQYRRNVEALESAQPAPLKADDVTIKLGATWIETNVIQDFAREALETWASINYSEASNTYTVSPTRGTVQGGRDSSSEWATPRRSTIELLDAVLNNRTIKIVDRDSDGKTYPNVEATVAANEVAGKIRRRFSAWIWEDAERAGKHLDLYNQKYNNIAGRTFDGSHLTLPGVSLRFNLHPHQKNAIWRIIQTGNTYIGHAVGAGKTMVMISAGMEMKRLGLVQKPIYVVPKHMLSQFSNEFMELYPMASIMVADEEKFHTNNRREFIAQAALNSPDAIIITHPSLAKLGMKQENIDVVADEMMNELRESLSEMEDANESRFLIKRVEKRIERLEQMFAGMVSSDKDQALTFEEIGADFMFVDEAHEFRKLDFATNRQAKGIDSSGSKRSIDLLIKTKWLGSQNPGRSHVFASGTPVTNTMGELYNLMKFFIEDEMEKDGIKHFDAWASMFGEVAPDFERDAAGRPQIVERFANFVNVPELMKRVRSFMDVLTFSDLGAFVKRPDMSGGKPDMVLAPQSPELTAYLKGPLSARLEASAAWKPSKDQPGNPDPVINIITDGRLASIDMRFINPNLKSDPNSKLNKMIDGVIETWKNTKDNEYTEKGSDVISKVKGGAQIVFYNNGFGEGVKARGFDARAWMAKRMKDAGIPASEIAWIDDADSSVKKARIFAEMRNGTKRILIGSAKKMGTGVNVQHRLHTLHYMDAPWFPADVEQPMGRIIRQGNLHDEVDIKWYATEGSYDSTMWQMVTRKARFIEQAFAGDDSVRRLEDVSAASQYAMATAISSGDVRVMQLASLKNEIERLTLLRRAHADKQRSMRSQRTTAEWNLGRTRQRLKELTEAAEKVGGYVREITGVVSGVTYTNRAEIGAAIQEKAQAIVTETGEVKGDALVIKEIGKINGYPLVVIIGRNGPTVQIVITKSVKGSIADIDGDPGGLVTRIANQLNMVATHKRDAERSIEDYRDEIKKYDQKIGAPFEYAGELSAKIAEAQQLQNELVAEGQQSAAPPPSDELLISIDEGQREEQGAPSLGHEVSPNRVHWAKTEALYSTAPPVSNPANTPAELRARLGKGYNALIESGKLRIVATQKEAQRIIDMIRGGVKYAAAWHGSPHKFGKFDISKIGTGEGAQAYGHGLYFASSKDVAEHYRNTLGRGVVKVDGQDVNNNFKNGSFQYALGVLFDGDYKTIEEAIAATRKKADTTIYSADRRDAKRAADQLRKLKEIGAEYTQQRALYKVELAPEADEYLDWDKPLSEQSEKVKAALKKEGSYDSEEISAKEFGEPSGEIIYNYFSKKLGFEKEMTGGWTAKISDDKAASEYLHSLGIRGIRYLDGTSRSKGDGNHNYVIFNDADIAIVEVLYSEDGKTIEGFAANGVSYLVEDGISTGKAWSTLAHELGTHINKLMLADPEFKMLVKSMEKRRSEQTPDGKLIAAAYKAVPKDTKAEHVNEEALAYLIANHPEVGLVRRIIAMVKRLLVKYGFKDVSIFTPADLRAIAEAAVSSEARAARQDQRADAKGMSPAGSPLFSIKGATSALRENFKHPTTEAFKRWFGKSKITSNGKPHILYHGTNDTRFLQDKEYPWAFDLDRPTRPDSSPFAGLGIFLGNDTIAMAHSGGNTEAVHPVYVRVENPLVITSDELARKVTDPASAMAFRKRAMEINGHDGIIIKDRGQVVAFEPNQVKSARENSGEFSRGNNDIRYSMGSAESTLDAAKTMAKLEKNRQEKKGSITVAKKTKPDSGFLHRLLSTPEYYFEKFPAAWRVLQAALTRRDLRFQNQQAILGDFAKEMQDLKKNSRAAYDEANEYLVDLDQNGVGFSIKEENDGSWKVMNGFTKKDAGKHATETEAIEAMISTEGAYLNEQGFSPAAIQAIKRAREVTNNGFNVMAADMRRIIQEAKENGLPDPFIGDGKFDETGRYGIYAAGRKQPVALFATEKEANEGLARAAEMIAYTVIDSKGGEHPFMTELRAKAWARKHGGTVQGKKFFQNLVVRQRTDAELRPLTVKQALAQMGDLRGTYFPRIRQNGDYILIAKKDGENPIRKHFDIPATSDATKAGRAWNMATPMGREAKRLTDLGYKIEVKRDESPSEDMFAATNLVTSIDAILQQAMKSVNPNDDANIQQAQTINVLLTMQVADLFKARGYLSSRMKRLKGDVVWEGYETDMTKALASYATGVAAGTAKRDTARAMILAFTGKDYTWQDYKKEVEKPDFTEWQAIVEERRIDPGKQKNLYGDVRNFIIDVLRNDDRTDRVIGTLRGIASLKFLAFRISSAAVNATNMVQGVPATMAAHLKIPLHKAMGYVTAAAVDYGKYRSGVGILPDADRKIFAEISARGWDEAQFNYEAAKELRGKGGEAWNWIMTKGMFMFGAVEKANRAMSIYAAYKAAYQQAKKAGTSTDMDVLLEQAHGVSNRAHGVYGDETLPAWTRGETARFLRLPYTFLKFSQNYLLNMWDIGINKREYAAAAHLLLAPGVLAGAGATLATPLAVAALGLAGAGGDDPEEEFYKWVEDMFGSDRLARHGLAGLAGINIKGSLQVNNPMPTKLSELAGAPGAIFADTVKGVKHLAMGEVFKGLEAIIPTAFGSMLRSVREGSEGVTTGNYGTVFYGNEPLKADAIDTTLRFLSFNPAGTSGIREKQWKERKVGQNYQEEKREIYAGIKRHVLAGKGITPEDMKAIVKFNERVVGTGRPDIRPITSESIRLMLRMNMRPSKLEMSRQVAE